MITRLINFFATSLSDPNGNKYFSNISEWKDKVKELLVGGISSLKEKTRLSKQKVIADPDVQETMSKLLWFLQIRTQQCVSFVKRERYYDSSERVGYEHHQ